jgi:NADPH-dependent 2,4-dienoyl-CoA reductase/sulfur reductase-like enzyme
MARQGLGAITGERPSQRRGILHCIRSRTRYRSEHWNNAIKQGRIAAWNMLGERQSWRTVSYFFTHVFDLTFNVVGSTKQAGERVVRGSIKDKSFSVL